MPTETAQAPPARATPAAEIPGPPGPRLAQTLLGVMRPLETRLGVRERYGRVFRTNEAIVGELFHIADRDLIELFSSRLSVAFDVVPV